MVRRALDKKIDFELLGTQTGFAQEQLLNFQIALQKYSKSKIILPIPRNWIEAFSQLQQFLVAKKGKKK